MARVRMLRRLVALLLAAGASLVVAAPVHAAATGLDGTIVDSKTGAPVAGVAVLAIPRTSGVYGNAVTDERLLRDA